MVSVPFAALPAASVAKKMIMAATGFLLTGFLAAHLAGNLLLFAGPELYNLYGHKLTSNPLIYAAEVVLAGLFLYHGLAGVTTYLENRRARPIEHTKQVAGGEQTIFSRSMIWSGALIVVFVILHLASFKFGPTGELGGKRDLYTLVVTRFGSVWYSGIYVLAMIVIGCHLAHALHSAARTLGFTQEGIRHHMRHASYAVALVVVLGFSSFPVYFCIRGDAVLTTHLEKVRLGAAAGAERQADTFITEDLPSDEDMPNLDDSDVQVVY